MAHQKTLLCSVVIGLISLAAQILPSQARAQPTGNVQWHAAVVRGKFEAQTFKPELVMGARMNEINRKSFSLWGTLKNHSKHAEGQAGELCLFMSYSINQNYL
jgi:hypothetical protein